MSADLKSRPTPSRDGKKARKGTPLIDRLMLHVELSGGCWIWTAALDNSGYGRIVVERKLRYAHRVSYTLHKGEIPAGLEIDHLCRNRACCCPDHLEAVTPSVNVRRGQSVGAKARRRTDCIYGHPYVLHGVMRRGRRICRLCQVTYNRLWRDIPYAEVMRRRTAGIPVVDLAAYFSAHPEEAAVELPPIVPRKAAA